MNHDGRSGANATQRSLSARRRPDLAALVIVAVVFASCAVALLAGIGKAASFACSFGPSAAVTAVLWIRVKRSDGRTRLMWISFATGMSFNAFGDLYFQYLLSDKAVLPALSPADVGYLATYPFLFAGVAVMIAERSRGRVRNILIDAGAVTVVAALTIWQFMVVNPGLAEHDTLAQRIVLSAYPLMDVLIIGALVGLLLSPGRRTRSTALLAAFAFVFLADDIFYNLIQNAGADGLVRVSDASYNVAYALLAAAALHRSASTLETGHDARAASRPRLVLLGVALIGSPTLAVLTPQRGSRYLGSIYIAAAVIVSLLVLSRLASLIRSLDREHRRWQEAEARLVHEAHRDSLTGLANRVRILDELNRAVTDTVAAPGSLVVLFIDLDRFKGINDRLGHRAGDDLLRTSGERIRSCTSGNDLAGRLGGDEFVVICRDSPRAEDPLQLADRIIAALGQPVMLGKDRVTGHGSVGIARHTDQRDASALLRDADLALYEAKAAGGRCVRVFDATMRASADERQDIELGLRRALKVGQLDVAYQPLRSFGSGQIFGVEALLRWPGRPDLPISRAIDVAERCGLIGQLGDWVLRRACADMARLNATSGMAMTVAVNVSVLQLTRPQFDEEVRAAVEQSQLDPSLLTLELTESFLADDPDHASRMLAQLRSLGVRLEIDDFGVGYSSLSRLSAFALDGLKIDRGFTAGLGQDATATSVVSAIVALAKSLNLTVTAEGVETADQASILDSLGCDHAQGYYYARPMPLAELEALTHSTRLVGTH
jgi:diguanylate cyclase